MFNLQYEGIDIMYNEQELRWLSCSLINATINYFTNLEFGLFSRRSRESVHSNSSEYKS
jgi:hypothetical protein